MLDITANSVPSVPVSIQRNPLVLTKRLERFSEQRRVGRYVAYNKGIIHYKFSYW